MFFNRLLQILHFTFSNLHATIADFLVQIYIPRAGNAYLPEVNLYFPREDNRFDKLYLCLSCEDDVFHGFY